MTAEVRPLDAESAVVGSILVDPRCLPVVEQLLRPEDLALAVHQTIYRAAVSLRRQDKPIDSVLIREEAAREGVKLDVPYLVELMDATPTAQNVEEYARLTRQNSLKRAVVRLCSEAREQAAEGDPGEVLAGLARDAAELQREGVTDDLIRPEEALMAFYEHRDAVDRGKATGCVSTGYRDIDLTLGGGMLAGGMYILAARPGMGKTSFALNMLLHAGKFSGKTVVFFSLEMSREQLAMRLISGESFVDNKKLVTGKLGEEDWTKIAAASAALNQTQILIDDNPSLSVADMNAKCRRVDNLGLVVIDYLQLMTSAGGPTRSGDNRQQIVSDISRALKIMAKELDVPVLCLSQLSRANESRSDKRPMLSDLRDSGSIEQDADTVFFLRRLSVMNIDEDPETRLSTEGRGTLSIAKNRHGESGEVRFCHNKGVTRFTDDRTPVPNDRRPAKAELDKDLFG